MPILGSPGLGVGHRSAALRGDVDGAEQERAARAANGFRTMPPAEPIPFARLILRAPIWSWTLKAASLALGQRLGQTRPCHALRRSPGRPCPPSRRRRGARLARRGRASRRPAGTLRARARPLALGVALLRDLRAGALLPGLAGLDVLDLARRVRAAMDLLALLAALGLEGALLAAGLRSAVSVGAGLALARVRVLHGVPLRMCLSAIGVQGNRMPRH